MNKAYNNKYISFVFMLLLTGCFLMGCSQKSSKYDDFSEKWLQIEVGMHVDDAKRILKNRYASMRMRRMDDSGYLRYWKVPNSIIGHEINEDFVFRGAIPHGDIYVIYINSKQAITSKEIIHVTEEVYQEEVQAHRDAKLKERINQ